MFEYSHEHFKTGIAEIDALEKIASLDKYNYAELDANGDIIVYSNNDIKTTDDYVMKDINLFSDNKEIQKESNTIIDFSEIDPFSEGNY
jgi:hypothetical protein